VNKVLLTVASIVLIAVAVVSGYVIYDPVSATNALGFGPDSSNQSQDTANRESGSDFDRKTAAAKEEEANRPPRPPARQEIVLDENRQSAIDIDRKGRYVGPVNSTNSSTIPHPELYPLEPNRITDVDEYTKNVEFAIKNESGTHWKVAYVALRSSRYPVPQLFEIQDWRIGEIVGLDYTFPEDELAERMTELRVISVTGEQRRSALAQFVSQSRRRYVDTLSRDQVNLAIRRDGDILNAPGLLAFFGNLQEPFTGIDVQTVEVKLTTPRVDPVKFPEEKLIPKELPVQIKESSAERKEASDYMQEFHQLGFRAQGQLQEFIDSVSSGEYQETMNQDARDRLDEIRLVLSQFNRTGQQLAMTVQRSTDPELKKAQGVLKDYSEKIRYQIAQIDSAIQRVDKSFRVQGY